MMELCEVLFQVDPAMTVESLMGAVRQLADYCDVEIDMRSLEIEYDDNGMNPQCWITGDMPDMMEDWERLDNAIKDIDGIVIDYESMRDWD